MLNIHIDDSDSLKALSDKAYCLSREFTDKMNKATAKVLNQVYTSWLGRELTEADQQLCKHFYPPNHIRDKSYTAFIAYDKTILGTISVITEGFKIDIIFNPDIRPIEDAR